MGKNSNFNLEGWYICSKNGKLRYGEAKEFEFEVF